MLKTFVLVSEVTNLSDARYCAGMGVNVLSFCVDATAESFVAAEKFKEIKGWLAGIDLYIESQTSNMEEILTLKNQYEADGVVISDVHLLDELKNAGINYLLRVSDLSNIGNFVADNEPVLLSIENDLSEELESALQHQAAILSSNLSTEQLLELIDNETIKGIELKGGEEERPGFTDFDTLMDILEALEVD